MLIRPSLGITAARYRRSPPILVAIIGPYRPSMRRPVQRDQCWSWKAQKDTLLGVSSRLP